VHVLSDELLAEVAQSFVEYQLNVLGIHHLLDDKDVTEICINRPGEVFYESKGGWHKHDVPTLTYERARAFCTAIVNESKTGQSITDRTPLVSFTFATGQRAQFVIPPAVEAGTVSITIRLPSSRRFTLSQYSDSGFFDTLAEARSTVTPEDHNLIALKQQGRYADFFAAAVAARKNIVVAGATGSGKTTFMKALVDHISPDERLVTIEDARELFLTQPNRVHLLYSRGGQSISSITAKGCMEACLRMKPDRILLAELRGDEAFFFVRNCASGHPGSITSCHAGSATQAWEQLALMIKASPEGAGLEYDVIKHLLKLTIDVMVHVHAHAGVRRITGIDFVPESLVIGAE
jgi:type IV secretion system protein VirB11